MVSTTNVRGVAPCFGNTETEMVDLALNKREPLTMNRSACLLYSPDILKTILAADISNLQVLAVKKKDVCREATRWVSKLAQCERLWLLEGWVLDLVMTSRYILSRLLHWNVRILHIRQTPTILPAPRQFEFFAVSAFRGYVRSDVFPIRQPLFRFLRQESNLRDITAWLMHQGSGTNSRSPEVGVFSVPVLRRLRLFHWTLVQKTHENSSPI